MNTGNSVGWYVYRSSGDKFGRGHNDRVEIDFGAEVGCVYGEGIK